MRTERAEAIRVPRAQAGLLTAVALALLALGVRPAAADAPAEPVPAMRLYRDPRSGAVGAPAGAAAAAAQNAASARQRIAAELREEAVEVPGGGVKINLRGAFRAAMTRGVTESGPSGHLCSEAESAPHE